MKGLIYREIYLARKNYFFGFVSYLIVILFGVLARISMLHGNLAKLSEETYNAVDKNTYYAFTLLPALLLFFSLMGEGGVIVSDYKSKWNMFSYTLPVSEKKQAAVKYGIKAAAMVVSLLLSMLNAAVIGELCGKGFDFGVIKYIFAVMLVAVLFSCAATPMYVKYRSSNAGTLRIFGVCAVIYVIIMIFLQRQLQDFVESHSDISEDKAMDLFADRLVDSAEKLRDVIFIVMPIIIIAAFALGFYFTVRFLKRREN